MQWVDKKRGNIVVCVDKRQLIKKELFMLKGHKKMSALLLSLLLNLCSVHFQRFLSSYRLRFHNFCIILKNLIFRITILGCCWLQLFVCLILFFHCRRSSLVFADVLYGLMSLSYWFLVLDVFCIYTCDKFVPPTPLGLN